MRSRPFQRGASELAKMYIRETRGRRVRAEGAHAAAKMQHFSGYIFKVDGNFPRHFQIFYPLQKVEYIPLASRRDDFSPKINDLGGPTFR